MRKVYRVNGTQTIEVIKYVKASSMEEAMELVNDMDIYLIDYANDTIGIEGDSESTEITEGGGIIEWNDVKEESDDHDFDSSTARYGYEIWLEGNMIHSSMDEEYEDEDSASEDAELWILDGIEESDTYCIDDFNVRIVEL